MNRDWNPGTRLHFFFGTSPQPCPYLPGRLESKIVTELTGRGAQPLHDALVRAGFRRSHGLAYRPACRGCDACIPVRLPAARYRPDRTQRRVWRRNQDLLVHVLPPRATREQFDVFRRYQHDRHSDGGMALMGARDFQAMVEESNVATRLVEARQADGRLIAVALTDVLGDGLSGIYKFFDPDAAARSPGTFMVQWHIARAVALGLPYVYLGYWIKDCAKMAYKARYRPLERMGPNGWEPLVIR